MTPLAPIVGIAGWKNSGKTTLLTRLVEHFTARGLRVATIKHAHHEVTAGPAQSDSARHLAAGASEVLLVASNIWQLTHGRDGEDEPDLEEMAAKLSPCDLILVEGYKSAPILKIEVRRAAQEDKEPLASDDPLVIGIAADHTVEAGKLPVLSLDDVEGIAALIEARLGPFGRSR